MIKVVDEGRVYYYDNTRDLHEDYPDAIPVSGVVIIKKKEERSSD